MPHQESIVFRTLEEIRTLFLRDRFATEQAGVVIDVAEPPQEGAAGPRVVCSMTVEPHHRNAAGGVMGGAIYTLADFCFAIGANAFARDTVTVTLSSSVQFIGACKGSRLIATLIPQHQGRSTLFSEVRVEDDLGNLLAMVSMTGFRRTLPPEAVEALLTGKPLPKGS